MPSDLFVETVFISFESMSSTIHGSAITFVTYSSNSMQGLNIFSRKLSKNTIVLLLMYLLVFLLFFCPLRTLPQTKSLMWSVIQHANVVVEKWEIDNSNEIVPSYWYKSMRVTKLENNAFSYFILKIQALNEC